MEYTGGVESLWQAVGLVQTASPTIFVKDRPVLPGRHWPLFSLEFGLPTAGAARAGGLSLPNGVGTTRYASLGTGQCNPGLRQGLFSQSHGSLQAVRARGLKSTLHTSSPEFPTCAESGCRSEQSQRKHKVYMVQLRRLCGYSLFLLLLSLRAVLRSGYGSDVAAAPEDGEVLLCDMPLSG
jgi:hypothetical protein